MSLLFQKNGPPLLVCGVIGFLLAHYLFTGVWATYAYILISYHLFLGWLVITAEHETGFSLPVLSTIVTHMACLAVLLSIAIGRQYIPFFGLIRYFVPALAPFECNWLFSGGTKKKEVAVNSPLSAGIDLTGVTAEDHEAWIQHLTHRDPLSRRHGMSVKEEYEQFLAARIKSRNATSASNLSA
jgi:hypothetical protein